MSGRMSHTQVPTRLLACSIVSAKDLECESVEGKKTLTVVAETLRGRADLYTHPSVHHASRMKPSRLTRIVADIATLVARATRKQHVFGRSN